MLKDAENTEFQYYKLVLYYYVYACLTMFTVVHCSTLYIVMTTCTNTIGESNLIRTVP